MAVAKLTAARQERTLYIRALEEKVRPLLGPAPTYSPDPKTCGRPFEVVMHGLDGETLSWIFLAPDQGLPSGAVPSHNGHGLYRYRA